MSEMHHILQEFYDAKLRITPLHKIVKGECYCKNETHNFDGVPCVSIGKHPMRSSWQTQNYLDEETLPLWNTTYAGHGMGWVLDEQHIVIDVDERSGGLESLKKLQQDINVDLFNECAAIVKTGGGGFHFYFKKNPSLSLGCKMPEKYKGIDIKQKGGFVVMPGSMHKSGNEYEWYSAIKSEISLLTALPEALSDVLLREHIINKDYANEIGIGDIDEIKDILTWLDEDMDYANWTKVGMAIHSATDGSFEGLAVWDKWSQKSAEKYTPEGKNSCSHKWHTFGKKSSSTANMGTLVYMGKAVGWAKKISDLTPSELKEIGDRWKKDAEQRASIPSIMDNADIDIYDPPGVLGMAYKYVYSCSPFDNRNMTLASALFSLGCAVGRKYYMPGFANIIPNIMVFCVAGAATGKGPILSATKAILRASGLGRTIRGDLKSAKDLLDAVQVNQYANYVMDEFGGTIKKLEGKLDHFDGAAEKLMEVFTAGNSDFGLSNDRSQAIREKWMKEVNTLTSIIESGKADSKDIPRLELKLDRAKVLLNLFDNQLPNPFFSLLGVSTPVSMSSAYSHRSAESGFLSRAMVFHEYETNPRPRPDFAPPSGIPAGLYMALKDISFEKDECPYGRIDSYGKERLALKVDPDALEFINRARDYLYDVAEQQKDNGLESLPRRTIDNAIKICIVMGAQEKTIDLPIARYAIKLSLHEMNMKIDKVMSTEGIESYDKGEQTQGLVAKIMEICKAKSGATLKHLYNRCGSKRCPNTVIKALVDKMVIEKELIADKSGKIEKYKAVE